MKVMCMGPLYIDSRNNNKLYITPMTT